MKKLFIVILICLLPTTLFAKDGWTTEDIIFQTTFILLQGIDWQQTKEIVRNPDHYEKNKILGKHPKQNEIDLYFLTTTALHTGIAYYLPEGYRRVWQCVWIGIQTHTTYKNYNGGIRINF